MTDFTHFFIFDDDLSFYTDDEIKAMTRLTCRVDGKEKSVYRDVRLPKDLEIRTQGHLTTFLAVKGKVYITTLIRKFTDPSLHFHNIITRDLPTEAELEEGIKEFQAQLKDYYRGNDKETTN